MLAACFGAFSLALWKAKHMMWTWKSTNHMEHRASFDICVATLHTERQVGPPDRQVQQHERSRNCG